MIVLIATDWGGMFVPEFSLVESFLRASFVYLSLVVLFRMILKRQTGSLGLPDVMLIVLVSECVSQALTAQASSISNGLAAVLGLLFWNYALDRLAHRWSWLQGLLEPQPIELVRNGQPIRENLDAEGITDDELEVQLRLRGIDKIAKVKIAHMEPDGEVSVIPKDEPSCDSPSTESRPPSIESAKSSDTPPNFDEITRQFLAAAANLQHALAWHEEQAEKHRDAAKAARKLLSHHGIRTHRTVEPQHEDAKA